MKYNVKLIYQSTLFRMLIKDEITNILYFPLTDPHIKKLSPTTQSTKRYIR